MWGMVKKLLVDWPKKLHQIRKGFVSGVKEVKSAQDREEKSNKGTKS